MREDAFFLPVTTGAADALARYDRGVARLLTANAGVEALLDEAIALDPGFALAHAARARQLQLYARAAEAREAAERARALAAPLPQRERGHVEAIWLAVHGQGARALDAVRAHMAAFPRDALVLSLALGVYGLIAFSGRREHHEEQRALLESLVPHWLDDGWFYGYLGWSLVETGDPKGGAELIDRALGRKPRNAHAAHARTHAYVELGQAAAGFAFLSDWLVSYDRAAILHTHLNWHQALFEIDLGRADAALARYAEAIGPAQATSPPMPTLADSASFLWRCGLYGAGPRPLPWDEVAALAARAFPKPGFAFADLHAAMAAAGAGDRAGVARRVGELEALVADGKLPQGAVVPLLCRALGAYADGDFGEAARLLGDASGDMARIAGSHAQREVFEDTLIASLMRAGQGARAREILDRRLARRPRAQDRRWLKAIPLPPQAGG
ncbi:MAG: tetratricopeptide repeat protein [Alphaproteobacteria bacterium]|nr:tetratricopeptide repeat protein [Alphaproteobacteria bacterium]